MRIVSGTHKGRRFTPPKNLPVRPTTDFAKEGLFNILRNKVEIEGSDVLDLCAGTGNISFEFASRGADSVLAVDEHFGCIKYIKQVAAELSLDNVKAIKANLFKFINRPVKSYDLIFADPPYGLEGVDTLADKIFESQLLKESGLLIIEHGKELDLSSHANFSTSRKFGNVNFTFFEPKV